MSRISFLAVPNIEGMRLWWYIQIFGIVILFGICLFFALYFLRTYRRAQELLQQSDHIDLQAQKLGKQLLIQKIQKSSGKIKLTLFIEYLERFSTNTSTGAWPVQAYANVWELLSAQWFTPEEVKVCEQVLYTDKELSKQLETKITKILNF